MTFYQKSKSRSLRDEIYYPMNALVSEGVGELGAVFTLLSLSFSHSLSLSLSLCLSHPYLLSISAAACLHIAFEKKTGNIQSSRKLLRSKGATFIWEKNSQHRRSILVLLVCIFFCFLDTYNIRQNLNFLLFSMVYI